MKTDYALGKLTRQRADGTARKVWAGIARPDKLKTIGDIVDGCLEGLGGLRDESKRRREPTLRT